MNSSVPSGFIVKVPAVTVGSFGSVIVIGGVVGSIGVPLTSVIMITSPSGSESLLSRFSVMGESLNVSKLSSVAIGGVLSKVVGSVGSSAFKSRTSMETSAVSVFPKLSWIL